MLGASGDGLQSQLIVLRVLHIDADKLKKAIGVEGMKAAGLNVALSVVDSQPKMALDVALPLAKNFLKDNYGVDAEITTSNAPPPARSKSEFFGGLVFGVGASTVVFGVGWATWKLLFRRIFT